MDHVTIIVLHYANHDDTTSCLQSLMKMPRNTHYTVDIILVDNGSVQPYVLPQQLHTYKVTYLRNEENLGYAGGMNIGMQYAMRNGATHVVVLNNDTEIDMNFLQQLMHTSRNYPTAGIIAPKIYFAKGFEYHKKRYKKHELGKVIWYAGGVMDWHNVHGYHRGVDEVDTGQYDRTENTDFGSGCCMLFTAKLLKKTGFFDEKYFLYYEDSDINERAKRLGFSVYFEPKAVVYHKNAGSSGGSGSPLQDYFISRNRLLFGMRYASFRARIALLRESIRLLFNGRSDQKKGVRDFYLRRFGKGSFSI